jgi:beta-N-acetylhexosaminidase
MLLVGFRGTSVRPDSPIIRTLKTINVGGVVLFDYDVPSSSFPRNIESPGQVRRLIRDLQSKARTPLLVAVDAEGGRINRLKAKYGFVDIPSAQALGREDPSECRSHYSRLAQQLRDLGINLNLAPVVDLNLNPKNPVIGALERSFSADAGVVTARASVFIEAHQGHGILTCLKHFPGHGSSREDSHLGLVDVTDTFQDGELEPYRALIRNARVDTVMTAHILHRGIDADFPATLSPRFLQNILRDRLGFSGVIISDDMQMGAISRNYGFAEALVQAVRAGCDILALANNGQDYDPDAVVKAHRILVEAVRQGKIPRSTIEASYGRIIHLKRKFGIIG